MRSIKTAREGARKAASARGVYIPAEACGEGAIGVDGSAKRQAEAPGFTGAPLRRMTHRRDEKPVPRARNS